MKLLAKSPHHGREVDLAEHLGQVYRAACALFPVGGDFTRDWLRFFRVGDALVDTFHATIRAGALLHDIGKANEEFQAAVRAAGPRQQSVRHEHFSALILALPEVRAWLEGNHSIDFDAVTAAVLSHHMKASESGEWAFALPRGSLPVTLHLGAPEVRQALADTSSALGLASPPALPAGPWDPRCGPWDALYAGVMKRARAFPRMLRRDAERAALVTAVKAGLVVADSAGSALVRDAADPATWIHDVLGAPRLGADEILDAVIQPKIAAIGRRAPFELHRFQRAAADLGPRGLVLAACGSGKTLAAWKWAEAQARERPIHHVVFLYPTRGTATEGFRDYVGFAPEDEATLLHASSRFELEAIAANPSEATRGKSFRDERDDRLRALAQWPRRYFSATVDQFLGYLEHGYGSTCLLPVLARSAVIVDEVHSFDRPLFGNLIALLSKFNVPVLCMTATLPPARRTELVACGLRVYPTDRERQELQDLEQQEAHPRYHLDRVTDAGSVEEQAADAYRQGRRVLCVSNTVIRCQRLARAIEKRLGTPVLVYHSRFRLSDRQRAHRRTVDAFEQRATAAIAVTTQVCEMSLDLDADVLFTETAPVPSLVQRFGRVNRHLASRPAFRGRLVVYPPESPLPYAADELRVADDFLAELCDRDLSQRDLALGLERHATADPAADGSARLLDGGFFATRGSLRDEDEHTVPCVLDGDLAAVEELRRRREPLDGFIVSVPRKHVREDAAGRPAWLPRHLGIASAALYDAERGFHGQTGGET